jgi:hypothetical protein
VQLIRCGTQSADQSGVAVDGQLQPKATCAENGLRISGFDCSQLVRHCLPIDGMLLQANCHNLSCSFDVMLTTGFASGLLSVYIGSALDRQRGS